MHSEQLYELSRPFPAHLVKAPPKGKYGDYVPHSSVTERLLSIVGPFDFEVVDLIRGYAREYKNKQGDLVYPERAGAVVGTLCRMTVTIDGRQTTVTEVGTEDNPHMHSDAESAKNAASDGLKRCAMRLGLGLHLWSQSDYFLEKQLAKGRGEDADA